MRKQRPADPPPKLRIWDVVTSRGDSVEIEAGMLIQRKDTAVFLTREPTNMLVIGSGFGSEDDVIAMFTSPISVRLRRTDK